MKCDIFLHIKLPKLQAKMICGYNDITYFWYSGAFYDSNWKVKISMIVDLICFGFGLLVGHLKMTSWGIGICDGHFLRVIDYQEHYFLFKAV